MKYLFYSTILFLTVIQLQNKQLKGLLQNLEEGNVVYNSRSGKPKISEGIRYFALCIQQFNFIINTNCYLH